MSPICNTLIGAASAGKTLIDSSRTTKRKRSMNIAQTAIAIGIAANHRLIRALADY